MVTKYCEFEPTQHRNKRAAQYVFLDDENDPHPLAICDVCTKKLLQMRPDALVRDRKEHEAARKEKRQAERAPPKTEADEPAAEDAQPSSESSPDPLS